ncbi:hypothetical protein BN14_10087 [Rhizoctonia solani AG-1 IB]|uniref:C2H2-type domain-containing protein n=1 Tax=Thanatephorus cucumeris (strain AG1-IB / isolate 7/3/14) TaxID=1108050 RepID=M5CA64_THACB|nr:hypothetical protein BN14_10087 [Rhizoctonia solani AG-1 IB]
MPLCSTCGKSFSDYGRLNSHLGHKPSCRAIRNTKLQRRAAMPVRIADPVVTPSRNFTGLQSRYVAAAHSQPQSVIGDTLSLLNRANPSNPSPESATCAHSNAPGVLRLSLGARAGYPPVHNPPQRPGPLCAPALDTTVSAQPHHTRVPAPADRSAHWPPTTPARNDPIRQVAPHANSPGDVPTTSTQTTQPRYYGYASTELHPTAGKVLYFEESVPELLRGHKKRKPEDLLKEKELFELAEWLANMSCTDRERKRYFDFEVHKRNLPWSSLDDMYHAIDNFEHGPDFRHYTFSAKSQEGSEEQDVYARCPLEVIRDLIGEEQWREHISYAPRLEWVQTADGRKVRVYSEMCSGKWWWRIQNLLPDGATLIPCIVSTDPTRLSVISGDKRACPVYFSIGNINKAIRNRPSERAMVLLGYIPDPKLEFIKSEKERREKKWQVYHAAMRLILDPLKEAGKTGVDVRCADGGIRRGYPVVAAQIGDWPELCTEACSQHTRCPACVEEYQHRGSLGDPARLRTKHQTLQAILDAMNNHTAGCKNLGLRPVWPYWGDLPYTNGAQLVVPDILHQVHKGMFKSHLYEWWNYLLGKAELDRRMKGLPRFHGLRYFRHGVSGITQWTGSEAKVIERTFLPLVAGMKPRGLVLATRAMMNLFFRAHLPQIDEDDLRQMDSDLEIFHRNKDIFQRCGAQSSSFGWNGISKLHMLRHFTHQIREMGATDGYTTETTERLHKYLVKNPYRMTSGAQDVTEQMVYRLQREEGWDIARSRLEREGVIPKLKTSGRVGDKGDFEDIEDDMDDFQVPPHFSIVDRAGTGGDERVKVKENVEHITQPSPRLVLAKRPTTEGCRITNVANDHNAPGLWEAIRSYINTIDPDLTFQLSPSMTIVDHWARMGVN